MPITIKPRPVEEVVLILADGREWRMICTWGTLRRLEQRFGPDAFGRAAGGGFQAELTAALLYESGIDRSISFEEFEALLQSPQSVLEAATAVLREAGIEPGELTRPAN